MVRKMLVLLAVVFGVGACTPTIERSVEGPSQRPLWLDERDIAGEVVIQTIILGLHLDGEGYLFDAANWQWLLVEIEQPVIVDPVATVGVEFCQVTTGAGECLDVNFGDLPVVLRGTYKVRVTGEEAKVYFSRPGDEQSLDTVVANVVITAVRAAGE